MSNYQVEINFNPETGRFLLQLSKEDVGLRDEPLTFQGKTFWPKEELHITVIGGALAEKLARCIQADPTLEMEVRQIIVATAWHYRLEDEWYHVVREREIVGKNGKEEAESIVRMASVPPLPGFYRRLQELIGVEIPERPAHVTLYTWNDARGIGIPTWDLFDKRVRGSVSPALWQ